MQREKGRRIAKKLSPPKVTKVKGVNVVIQCVEGLSAEQLLALSDYYRSKYGAA